MVTPNRPLMENYYFTKQNEFFSLLLQGRPIFQVSDIPLYTYSLKIHTRANAIMYLSQFDVAQNFTHNNIRNQHKF